MSAEPSERRRHPARNGLRLVGEGSTSRASSAPQNRSRELELEDWDRVTHLCEIRAAGARLYADELELLIAAAEAFGLEPHAAAFRRELAAELER